MLILGDCIEVMAGLDAESVDAVVTDPPYGIGFMGKVWDGKAIEEAAAQPRDLSHVERLTGDLDGGGRHLAARTGSAFQNRAGEAGAYDFSPMGNRAFQAWCQQWGEQALRVLKPGGHILVFGGTRTYHRLTAGLEDAGFEIRDCLMWLYGSGFPKSLDVGKAIDKAAGATRDVVGYDASRARPNRTGKVMGEQEYDRSDNGATLTAPATDDAKVWDGWGTALKPSWEPIVVARKPVAGTVAQNVLAHGTGALNIDACRIEVADKAYARNHSGDRGHAGTRTIDRRGDTDLRPGGGSADDGGRWPANLVLDEDAAGLLDAQTGSGESRFFYCAKVSRAERNAGLDVAGLDLTDLGFEEAFAPTMNDGIGAREHDPGDPRSYAQNHHPTVKPIALMRWLLRLAVRPGGTVLDPFLGSGSTGIAAALEGYEFVGIEREPDYLPIADARIRFWTRWGDQAVEVDRKLRRAAESNQLIL